MQNHWAMYPDRRSADLDWQLYSTIQCNTTAFSQPPVKGCQNNTILNVGESCGEWPVSSSLLASKKYTKTVPNEHYPHCPVAVQTAALQRFSSSSMQWLWAEALLVLKQSSSKAQSHTQFPCLDTLSSEKKKHDFIPLIHFEVVFINHFSVLPQGERLAARYTGALAIAVLGISVILALTILSIWACKGIGGPARYLLRKGWVVA